MRICFVFLKCDCGTYCKTEGRILVIADVDGLVRHCSQKTVVGFKVSERCPSTSGYYVALSERRGLLLQIMNWIRSEIRY